MSKYFRKPNSESMSSDQQSASGQLSLPPALSDSTGSHKRIFRTETPYIPITKDVVMNTLRGNIDEAGKQFSGLLKASLEGFAEAVFDVVQEVKSEVQELKSDVRDLACRFDKVFGRDADDLSHNMEFRACKKLAERYKKEFKNYAEDGLEIDCYCEELSIIGECSIQCSVGKLDQVKRHRESLAQKLGKTPSDIEAHFFSLWTQSKNLDEVTVFSKEHDIQLWQLSFEDGI